MREFLQGVAVGSGAFENPRWGALSDAEIMADARALWRRYGPTDPTLRMEMEAGGYGAGVTWAESMRGPEEVTP